MTAADKAPQPEHCEHECVCWLYPDNFEGACDADACGADTRSRPHTPAPASEPAFPNSTQLIKMAHTDWKNREERRGIHDENDWCAGWITGYLTPNKPSPAPTDEQCRICSEAVRNKTMDEFGILHGKDAKRFHDYINNPPEETPKSKAMIKQAYEISKTISLDPDHDAAIARTATLAENKRVLEKMVNILAAHTIQSDNFVKDGIKSGWVLVGGYEPIIDDIESLRRQQAGERSVSER